MYCAVSQPRPAFAQVERRYAFSQVELHTFLRPRRNLRAGPVQVYVTEYEIDSMLMARNRHARVTILRLAPITLAPANRGDVASAVRGGGIQEVIPQWRGGGGGPGGSTGGSAWWSGDE